jgi:hypothetical protein
MGDGDEPCPLGLLTVFSTLSLSFYSEKKDVKKLLFVNMRKRRGIC